MPVFVPATIRRRDGLTVASAGASPSPEPVLLIIADISGYTRYMTANAKTLAHSQVIITELVMAIIKAVELPIEVAKLEGDAVFLYCRKRDGSHFWPDTKRLIGEKLLTFFRVFGDKVNEMHQSTTCTCNACNHIENLRLKVIVHSGEALFHQVFNFIELAGVDVIVVHRLLKNSVDGDQYLLLTEAARRDLEFPGDIAMVAGSEVYDDIGRINTLVYQPDAPGNPSDLRVLQNSIQKSADRTPPPGFTSRFARSWRLYSKLWFAPLKLAQPDPSSNAIRRYDFALLTLLLTPIMFPVGTLFVLGRVLRQSTTSDRQDSGCARPDPPFGDHAR